MWPVKENEVNYRDYMLGGEPRWNETVVVKPGYGDEDPVVHVDYTRQMFIEEQNTTNWWHTYRRPFNDYLWDEAWEQDPADTNDAPF